MGTTRFAAGFMAPVIIFGEAVNRIPLLEAEAHKDLNRYAGPRIVMGRCLQYPAHRLFFNRSFDDTLE
jgi:hypothetical protein